MKTQLFIILATVLLLTGCGDSTQPKKQSITITTTELPQWVSGQFGTFTLVVNGGSPPFNWKITGTLPDGITFNNGVISGKHKLNPGTSKLVSPPFTINATDSNGLSVSVQLTITVVEPPPQLIPVAGVCTAGVVCETKIANAVGGTLPYTFQSDTFREGAPPMGMIIDVNGDLVGTPDEPGIYTFGVCVKDSVALSDCGQSTVTVEEPEETISFETWSGKMVGGYSPRDCGTGEFSYDFSISLTLPGSMITALEDVSGGDWIMHSDEGNKGTLSISSSVAKPSSEETCRLVGDSASNIPIGATVGENRIDIFPQNDESKLLPGYYEIFREDDLTKLFDVELVSYGFYLDVNSISGETVSGTWDEQFGSGTFTLTKK